LSEPLFERLAVVGLGLVGGSVALAARERGLAAEIRGVDPLLGDSAGPIPATTIEEAGAWADLVVLAIPIGAYEAVLTSLAATLRPETLLTDTASVKLPVAEAARRLLPAPERMVGAHPMAGGDATGFAHARADLFEGAACILALEGHEPPGVVDRVEQFWQCLGTFTVRQTPAEHDAIVAALSHAPHAIAYAFARGLPQGGALALAGAGLRDFVRIARANPKLWCEILLRNRSRVAEEVARFEKNLGEIRDALARADRTALEALLEAGRAAVEDLER
jgi:prephenate dehydrogenase